MVSIDAAESNSPTPERATENNPHAFGIAAVFAAYNVARYLPELFASLERQTLSIGSIQLVFVDDGSTDDTLALIRNWAQGRESHVTVISQENAWVAEARNTGLRAVDADWVTFPDADDVFDDHYFEEVAKFIDLHGRGAVDMLATHQLRFGDNVAVANTHPLRLKFMRGSRIIDIGVEPVIQLAVNSAFFRVDEIARLGIAFDGRVRPVFEDAHFVSRYLLETNAKAVGVLASAKYHYRMRGDGTSLMESHFGQASKYTDVLQRGHLDLLRRAADRGPIPRWLEYVVLYDLFWYFKNERAINSPSAVAPKHVFDRFHGLVAEIRALISDDAIRSFDVMGVEFAVRQALLIGYDPEPARPSVAVLDRVDENRQHVKLSYLFTGPAPAEVWVVDGVREEPLHQTVQNYDFYGRTLLRRRRVWLRRGRSTEVTIDGSPLGFVTEDSLGPEQRLTRRQLHPFIMEQRAPVAASKFSDLSATSLRWMKQRAGAQLARARNGGFSRGLKDAAIGFTVRSGRVRRRFEHAWVFMDRDTDANDNAEHLYRWVRRFHPEINAWFVLDRGSRDWQRLEAEGFRLVAYRSTDWTLLLLHADHLASSHIDEYVVKPLDVDRYGPPKFKFTWLQHGVTNYDISRWINPKPIELLSVVTPQERQTLAGAGLYSFSDREVVLTGFPRHDELLRKRHAVEQSERDLVVVMPTWRKKLSGVQSGATNDRIKNPFFAESEYARAYSALLQDERLRDLAVDAGKRIVFMPHPNTGPYLEDFDLPTWIDVYSFADRDVQDVIAHAAAFVTDYSSLGFEAAFLDVPLVYFQFDYERFFDGSHVGREGTFVYDRDGFGPVAEDANGVIARIAEIRERGWRSDDLYTERARQAFPTRDEDNCARVFAAMKALDGAPRLVEPQAASVSSE